MTRPLRAIIWDFDNTLVDTGERNLSVTRRIVQHVTGRHPDEFAMLRARDSYERTLHTTLNWQMFYAGELGMTPEQVREAGRLWTEFQLADRTPTSWFPGVADTVSRLSHVPHGIVSLNTRQNIEATLRRERMSHAFGLVVGCGEVPYDRQKPSPEGLMACVDELTGGAAGVVAYVGDHPVDSECARNADHEYRREGRDVRVVSIAATYGTAIDGHWPVEPGHRAERPERIVEIVESLVGSAEV